MGNMEQRRQKLMQYIKLHNTISVNKLIDLMDESPATIRRDLTFLAKNGIVTRTHGYVKYIHPDIVHKIEISPEKVAVAIKAAELIPQHATIFLDSGASSLALAHQIKDRTDITVYTNSLSAANVFASTSITTYLVGGLLEGRQECFVGPETEARIASLHFPILFLTTTGVRNTVGLTCVTPLQASLKKAMIQASDKIILLADSKKFETDAIMVFSPLSALSTVIVDKPLTSNEQIETLKHNGVELIIAEE